MKESVVKLCDCGCGKPAPIAKKTSTKDGWIKGKSVKFISGHNAKLQPKGRNSYRFIGIKENYQGRFFVYKPNYYRAYEDGYIPRAVFLAEKVFKKRLTKGAVMHHSDCNPGNDSLNNLVICENRAYHLLLHARERAYRASGHPGWRKCRYCKQYDDPKNLYISPGNNANHRLCYKKYRIKWESKKNAV